MGERDLTANVIGAIVEVQRVFGPGLLESAYAAALSRELTVRGIRHEREQPIVVAYKGAQVGLGFRADFVVEDQLVLELKTVESLLPVHRAQLLSYLRLAGIRLGLLVNFHQWPVTRGIQRVIDTIPTS